MRILLAIAVLALAGCAAPVSHTRLDAMTGRLEFDTGGCSATQIGPKALATTRHCVEGHGAQIRYQGILVNVVKVLYDRHQNAIVLIDRSPGNYWAQMAAPKVGESVWVVGNPSGLRQVLRESRVSWYGYEPKVMAAVVYHDCRCWNGDSGAGLFDGNGRLVAIHYGSYAVRWRDQPEAPVEWFYPMAYPLTFTPEQLAEAQQ